MNDTQLTDVQIGIKLGIQMALATIVVNTPNRDSVPAPTLMAYRNMFNQIDACLKEQLADKERAAEMLEVIIDMTPHDFKKLGLDEVRASDCKTRLQSALSYLLVRYGT